MGLQDPTRAVDGPPPDKKRSPDLEGATAVVPTGGLATADGTGPDAQPERHLQRGSTIGRYVVLEPLASGGMGAIWIAYDPELDRRVALKLLKRQHVADLGGEDSLLREAQAQAKLSHPNVVNVFDTGLHEGEVFVAMEYVEGTTLRQWLQAERRSWREVLEMYIQAGRGLEAAHRAGIVHRDFKPANVMVDRDGRPRVLDFGLAQRVTAGDSAELLTSGSLHGYGSVDSSSGNRAPAKAGDTSSPEVVVRGTPMYMSPEQWQDALVDARSDQFGFCVALWDALYDGKPFTADRMSDLRQRILDGAIDPPYRPRGPARLRRHLERGLAVDPKARYPEMSALLAELESDVRLAWRRGMFAAVLTGGLGLLGLGYWGGEASRNEGAVCTDARDRIATVWNADVRAELERDMMASGEAYAGHTIRSVTDVLERTAEEWASMHTEACEATRIRKEQSESMLDRRMRCLDRRLVEIRSTAELLTTSEEHIVRNAVKTAERITPITQCSAQEVLIDKTPPPESSIADEVDAVEAELAGSLALIRAGKYEQAQRIIDDAAKRADGLGYPPLIANIEAARTDSFLEQNQVDGAAAAWQRGFAAAIEGHDDGRAAQLAAMRLRIEALRVDEKAGQEAMAMAMAWVSRGSASPRTRHLVESNSGVLAYALGDLDAAQASFERALAIAREHMSGERQRAATTLNNLGSVAGARGNYEESLEFFAECLAILEETLGEHHPSTAMTLENIAVSNHLLGHLELARDQLEEAMEVLSEVVGAGDAKLARGYNNLSAIYLDLDEPERALEAGNKAVELRAAALGDEHPETARVRATVANAQIALGRLDEARRQVDLALLALERLPDAHPNLVVVSTPHAKLLRHRGEFNEAWKVLDRVVELRERFSLPENWLAVVESERAKIMAARGDDLEAVRAQVQAARNAFDGLEHKTMSLRELGDFEQWLEEHPQYRPNEAP